MTITILCETFITCVTVANDPKFESNSADVFVEAGTLEPDGMESTTSFNCSGLGVEVKNPVESEIDCKTHGIIFFLNIAFILLYGFYIF